MGFPSQSHLAPFPRFPIFEFLKPRSQKDLSGKAPEPQSDDGKNRGFNHVDWRWFGHLRRQNLSFQSISKMKMTVYRWKANIHPHDLPCKFKYLINRWLFKCPIFGQTPWLTCLTVTKQKQRETNNPSTGTSRWKRRIFCFTHRCLVVHPKNCGLVCPTWLTVVSMVCSTNFTYNPPREPPRGQVLGHANHQQSAATWPAAQESAAKSKICQPGEKRMRTHKQINKKCK